jgi:uncharacterized protein YcfJ
MSFNKVASVTIARCGLNVSENKDAAAIDVAARLLKTAADVESGDTIFDAVARHFSPEDQGYVTDALYKSVIEKQADYMLPGATVGGVAGGVLGSALGPAGTAAGASLGTLAGGYIGSRFGKKRENYGGLGGAIGTLAGGPIGGAMGYAIGSQYGTNPNQQQPQATQQPQIQGRPT